MKFKVVGNFLGTEVFQSKKSGENYRIVKVLVNDDKYQCFTDLDLNLNGFERLEEVGIDFELTPYNNTYNLNILNIDKIK